MESCTGGLVAKLITDVPDSSRWFECGFVTYANSAKRRDVGVQGATLEAHGAVSEQTVREMASGALTRTDAHRAIAISGVAGPGGGTERNPVGSVWFALASRWAGQVRVRTKHHQFAGDRDAIRRSAAAIALRLLAEG